MTKIIYIVKDSDGLYRGHLADDAAFENFVGNTAGAIDDFMRRVRRCTTLFSFDNAATAASAAQKEVDLGNVAAFEFCNVEPIDAASSEVKTLCREIDRLRVELKVARTLLHSVGLMNDFYIRVDQAVKKASN